jgi:hypothetical protein
LSEVTIRNTEVAEFYTFKYSTLRVTLEDDIFLFEAPDSNLESGAFTFKVSYENIISPISENSTQLLAIIRRWISEFNGTSINIANTEELYPNENLIQIKNGVLVLGGEEVGNSVASSKSAGEIKGVNGNAINFSNSNEYQNVLYGNPLSINLYGQFTQSDRVLTYLGESTKLFAVSINITAISEGGGSFNFSIFVNDELQENTTSKLDLDDSISNSTSSFSFLQISTGDTIRLRVENATGTSPILVTNGGFSIFEI